MISQKYTLIISYKLKRNNSIGSASMEKRFLCEYLSISFLKFLASIFIHLKSLSDGLFDNGMTSQYELCFGMCRSKKKGLKFYYSLAE